MTSDRTDLAVRVPKDLLARAMALVPLLQATPWGDAVRWSAASMVRLALSRGLLQLETELGAPIATAEDTTETPVSDSPKARRRRAKPKGRQSRQPKA